MFIHHRVLLVWREAKGSVVIPEGVTAIYRNAFANCINLVSVVLPESLEKMNFPAGLNIIGYNAFEGCDKLQKAPDATEEDPYRDIHLIHLEFL